MKYLRRKLPEAFHAPDEPKQLEGVSTGSLAVDHIVGNGGFPRGKLSEVFGRAMSGKSTLCATACAAAQTKGLYPVYVDVERGLDRTYAERIGFRVGEAMKGTNGLYVTPETFEEALTVVQKLADGGLADLIFVDSVAALVPKAYFEGDVTDYQKIGTQARMMTYALPMLTKLISRPGSKTALVFVNQIRARIQTGWAPPGAAGDGTKAAGGYSLEHASSIRVELKQAKQAAKTRDLPSLTDATKVNKVPVASLHTAFTFKNKVAPPYQKIEFYIRFDPAANQWGIDNLQTIIDMALTRGAIEIKGSGLYHRGGIQVRGEEALWQWFFDHPDDAKALRTELGLG